MIGLVIEAAAAVGKKITTSTRCAAVVCLLVYCNNIIGVLLKNSTG
jgi:hypothetical protein